MKNFDDWFKELTSDTRWYELLRAYRDTTIKEASKRVYANCVADGTIDRPMSENRKHVYNILCKNPGDKVNGKNWYQLEAEKKALTNPLADPNCPHCKGSGGVRTGEDEYSTCPCVWKPADPAHVDKCVKEFFDMLNNSPMVRYKPPSREVFYNEPKEKLPPYPVTSLEEAYIKDRHFEYIKQAFEPRTGQPIPGALSEKEFNRLYDEGNI